MFRRFVLGMCLVAVVTVTTAEQASAYYRVNSPGAYSRFRYYNTVTANVTVDTYRSFYCNFGHYTRYGVPVWDKRVTQYSGGSSRWYCNFSPYQYRDTSRSYEHYIQVGSLYGVHHWFRQNLLDVI